MKINNIKNVNIADALSIFPVVQQAVGAATIVSNVGKSAVDLGKIFKAKVFDKLDNSEERVKDLKHHVKYIGVGAIRMTPIVGTIFALIQVFKSFKGERPQPTKQEPKQKPKPKSPIPEDLRRDIFEKVGKFNEKHKNDFKPIPTVSLDSEEVKRVHEEKVEHDKEIREAQEKQKKEFNEELNAFFLKRKA